MPWLLRIIVITLLLVSSGSYAQFNGCLAGFCPNIFGGGGSPTAPCSTMSLDFTDSCNMILIPALIR